ncbi:enhancer of mRNA-decapping protein 4-like [Olea europaea var. sylvestris]|uniref:enhancer of mRNA-decapping protein 4-like n=1 Tax=Olea europaea var. sylvestris TaxID=158386 RepID=UPI000C1D180E|nr:enhancer of mRNA-decapping protein 4-like [Olea europaea var. sylvestris]
MASPGNPNPNQPGGSPFDINKLFRTSTPPPISTANPNLQNPNSNTSSNLNFITSPFPAPSASYPPPVAGGVPYSYSPQSAAFHHPVYNFPPNHLPANQDFANMHSQRSLSYPTPSLQPQTPTGPVQNNFQNPPSSQNTSNPNPGARLMALLSAPPSTLEIPQQPTMPNPQFNPTSSAGFDFSATQNVVVLPSRPNLGIWHPGPVIRMLSSKPPRGRHLMGDNLVYDVDVRFPGEVQPQLEVTPITKYGSDPGLFMGRQIAVNKTYICYGLKLGAIRVLNINTALRSLLKGLAQRVTDMTFFAEDVHLLASASMDGRVYVWKIIEGPDEEDKPQITGRIVVALQITGAGESIYPRVCWHCHKQEVLVVGIGKHVLKIDTTKFGKGQVFSMEEPLKCPVEKLINGVQLVGSHDGEVTDLSMCQWMTTRLVSASVDGTIKIWEDRKSIPIAALRPHDGQPVNSVTFLAAPHRPDHIILITGGPFNREVKIWASASEEGWLLPSDAESWQCSQTLELKSSTEARVEEVFFNEYHDDTILCGGLPMLTEELVNSILYSLPIISLHFMQETLKLSLEASVIPAFEKSCRVMFEQLDATFQKGMVEHTAAAQQQIESSYSPMAVALRDAMNSASSVTQTLSTELLDGQRKLLALAVAGVNSKSTNPLISQLSNGPLGGLHEKLEVPPDPTKELSRLIAEHKYEEAFTAALQRSDVSIVSWLCAQVDLLGILSMNPLPLSQGVLIFLFQQLAYDISKETQKKLPWMREVLSAINPTDPMIVVHVQPIFEQVYQILNHHLNLPTTTGPEPSIIRLIMHVINSILMTPK